VCDLKTRYAESEAVLIGHSIGCRVALEAYRMCPDRVIGLVLVDGSRFAGEDADRAVSAYTDQIRAVGPDVFFENVVTQMFIGSSPPELVRRGVARTRREHHEFAEAVFLGAVRWDVSDEATSALASVDVPVLGLQSTEVDARMGRRSLQPRMVTRWTKLVEQHTLRSELRIVPGVGHFPHIEAADVVVEHISEFVARVAI
jgi:pimeloyl-ACP methyl ester carboxylesterase